MSTSSGFILPAAYRLFFLTIEPIATLVGAYFAHFQPQTYLDLTHAPSSPSLCIPLGTQIVLTQLSNLYLVFALNEALVLRATSDLKVWRTLLFCLLIADLGHLYSVNGLGWDVYLNVMAWNAINWGNVGFVYLGAMMRVAFLAGIGMPEQYASALCDINEATTFKSTGLPRYIKGFTSANTIDSLPAPFAGFLLGLPPQSTITRIEPHKARIWKWYSKSAKEKTELTTSCPRLRTTISSNSLKVKGNLFQPPTLILESTTRFDAWNNSLEIVHEDVMKKYELRQIAPKSRLHPDPQAYCPKEHDGLTLNWSGGPKIFFHGDVLGDGRFRCSNFGAERNKYIRNLAEHFYIKVPEEEFFSIVDFPNIVSPNSKTARPYDHDDASGGGGFDRGFLSDNAPSDDVGNILESFDFDSYCSDVLPLYHGDFEERNSLRLQTNGGNIPNPRITPNLADARLPIRGFPDRFSIIETVNMGTGIIAAGGAVVSATAAVQGMRHLRTQARATPHSDLEQGISDDGNSETAVVLCGTEALEAGGIASKVSKSSLVAPKQPSLLAQATRKEQTLSNRSHAAWSPSLDTNQRAADSNSNTVLTVTTEAALTSRETERGNGSPSIAEGHARSDEYRGLSDVPISDPTATNEDEPVKPLSKRPRAALNGLLLSTAGIDGSDQIVLPPVPSTDPVPTIAVKRPHSPSSDKEEAVASRRCHTSLADS